MFSTSKSILRTSLLIGICIVVLLSSYKVLTAAFTEEAKPAVKTEEPMTLKKSIAIKAEEEYNRWHSNGTVRETDTAATNILLQYWKLGVIPVKEANLRNSRWQFEHPWSAVFISYVMQQAGCGDRFRFANAHSKYIVWARNNAKMYEQPLFAAYDLLDSNAAWPEPGDLICMNRRNKGYNMQSIDTNCISHCDIVVAVNKEERFITTVGGNILQTVSKRIVWLDENGFIDTSKNWKVLDEAEGNPEGSQKQIFGVIKVNSSFQ